MKKHDLSKLTHEQKLELYNVIQEKKRRLKMRRAVYTPNDGQLPIHISEKSIKFCASGNGAGKTAAAVHEVVWALLGFHPFKKVHTKVPATVVVVLDKANKSDSVWVPEIKKWFDTTDWEFAKKGTANTQEINLVSGSRLLFLSHEMDPLAWESIQADAVAYDEPPPRALFIAMRRATRKKNTKPWHLIIGTPLAQSWLRTEIYEPWAKGELPEAECFRMSSDVNKENINWEEQENNFRFMTEKERQVRRHGNFFDLSGLALASLFKRDVHIIDSAGFTWDKQNPCVLVIDPHGAKPHVAVILGVDRDNKIYVLAETAKSCTPSQFAQHLKTFMEPYSIIDIVCDSYGNSSSGIQHIEAEGYQSFIRTLKDNGVPARATTYKEKSDEDFVSRIQDSLRIPFEPDNLGQMIPKLRILDRCTATIVDIENVEWQRDKKSDSNKPKLDIQHRDYLACVKYGLATNLYYDKNRQRIYYRQRPNSYGGTKPKKEAIQSAEDWLKD